MLASSFSNSVVWQAKQRLIVCALCHLVQLTAAVSNKLNTTLYEQMDQSISIVYVMHSLGNTALYGTFSGSQMTSYSTLSSHYQLVYVL